MPTPAFILLLFPSAALPKAQVVVAAHQSVTADTLSSERFRDLYTGDSQTWDGGELVVLFNLKVRRKSPSRVEGRGVVCSLAPPAPASHSGALHGA